jgi:hypothetical protein
VDEMSEFEDTKRWWVRYTASILMPAGFDAGSPHVTDFLVRLTDCLQKHSDLSQPGVLSSGVERAVLTSVVEAPSKNGALAKALNAYVKCIDDAALLTTRVDSSTGRAHELVPDLVVTASVAETSSEPQVCELIPA